MSGSLEAETYVDCSANDVDWYEFGFDSKETDYPLEPNSSERASLIGAFETVFNGENSPYDENWDYENLDEFLDSTEEKDYEGVIVVDEGRVAGFAWGYRIDPSGPEMEGKFPGELDFVDEEIYDGSTFMIDEVGVMPDYRGQKLGTRIESALLDRMERRDDISRVMQRTQWSGQNIPKLVIDTRLGFDKFTFSEGVAEEPVLEEVEFVGKDGSDERVYLWKELGGEIDEGIR